MGFICTLGHQLGPADSHCFLGPLLRPYLKPAAAAAAGPGPGGDGVPPGGAVCLCDLSPEGLTEILQVRLASLCVCM